MSIRAALLLTPLHRRRVIPKKIGGIPKKRTTTIIKKIVSVGYRMSNKIRHLLVALLVLIILVVVILCLSGARECFEQERATQVPLADEEATIFVSIASYRDKQCSETILDIYKKAQRPDRVFVGICEQNTSDPDEYCIPHAFEYMDRVRRITIPNIEAKGPTYARYLCSLLYRGETYFCQIDSHSTFTQDWDAKAINNIKLCASSKPVLTHYPHDRNAYDIEEKSVPVLCDSSWNEDGLLKFNAIIKPREAFDEGPLPVPFTSGGFIFAPGGLIVDCPYDPQLDYLFQGEEIAYSARAWTHGYDFYTPIDNIVMHEYYRSDAPKFHQDNPEWRPAQRDAARRVRRILQLEQPSILPGDDPYGLGVTRSINEYWAFAQVDPQTKTSASKKRFCDS
jgi:Glycosyltransferase (GlcNAc)